MAALAANNHRDFCAHVAQANLVTMASGGQPPAYKYYFYGTSADGSGVFLVEMVVATANGQAATVIKSDAAEYLKAQFVEVWTMCLAGFER